MTLPRREARIRIASDAEAAQSPAPNMRPPRLLGNTGEMGEFILPLNIPAAPGSRTATLPYDDFTFQAASWTLTAHEARPGHELQFARIIEAGVSTARALFAFNSVNVEGWGLYAEWMMLPYMSAEGQLISLQFRLMRAARAFLERFGFRSCRFRHRWVERGFGRCFGDGRFLGSLGVKTVLRFTRAQ